MTAHRPPESSSEAEILDLALIAQSPPPAARDVPPTREALVAPMSAFLKSAATPRPGPASRRIPEADIVFVGRPGPRGKGGERLARHFARDEESAPEGANQNGRGRMIVVGLLTLLIVSGAAYTLLRMTKPNIIVVPAPLTDATRIV